MFGAAVQRRIREEYNVPSSKFRRALLVSIIAFQRRRVGDGVLVRVRPQRKFRRPERRRDVYQGHEGIEIGVHAVGVIELRARAGARNDAARRGGGLPRTLAQNAAGDRSNPLSELTPARIRRTVVQSHVMAELRPSSERRLVDGGVLSTAVEACVESGYGGGRILRVQHRQAARRPTGGTTTPSLSSVAAASWISRSDGGVDTATATRDAGVACSISHANAASASRSLRTTAPSAHTLANALPSGA